MNILDQQIRLLQVERASDVEETQRLCASLDAQALEKKGVCLRNLRITGMRTGLGGSCVVELEPGFTGMAELPANRFRSGDVVQLAAYAGKKKSSQAAKFKSKTTAKTLSAQEETAEEPWRAVVHRISATKITLVLDGNKEEAVANVPPETGRYRIDRLADDVSYERMTKSLEEAKRRLEQGGANQSLVRVLLGEQKPLVTQYQASDLAQLQFRNAGLNEPQKEAVCFALAAQPVALIHGPPGTGKTTVLVEILHQLLKQNLRILVCAPSNIAVDNVAERMETKEPMIRLGHPSRILPQVLAMSLDVQLRTGEGSELIADIRKELDALHAKLSSGKTSKPERRTLYQEGKALRTELRSRERQLLSRVLSQARIVFTTLSGAGSRLLQQQQQQQQQAQPPTPFDVVVVDEVSQSLEAECWIACLHAPKLILAGDPHQLPPTVKSLKAAKAGLEHTLFDRLQALYGEQVLRLLSVQYRMHQTIMDWANAAMYEGKLTAHISARDRIPSGLPGVEETDDTRETLVLVDTAGCHLWETAEEDGESKFNEGEAKLCVQYVQALRKAGISASEIAVITPYNAQVQQIRNLLGGDAAEYRELEVGSVDGFQGREKEMIVLSLVRSNDRQEVGFLAEQRRLNVAVTRAKRQVCLICDTDTVRKDPFMKQMVEYFEEHADLRYAYMMMMMGGE